jgi:hypothetical protein
MDRIGESYVCEKGVDFNNIASRFYDLNFKNGVSAIICNRNQNGGPPTYDVTLVLNKEAKLDEALKVGEFRFGSTSSPDGLQKLIADGSKELPATVVFARSDERPYHWDVYRQ